MSFNLATMLRESARARGPQPMLYVGDQSLSYGEVELLTRRMAAGLLAAGLAPGEKVAVQLPNLAEFVIAYFGILRAGLVMVPLNPLLTAAEIGHHLDDSDARVLITHALYAEAATRAAGETGDVPVYLVGGEGLAGATGAFEDLLADEATDHLHPTASDDTAVLLYTSGTTGRPKGAELTHFQLYMNCTVSGDVFGLAAEDVSIAALPLFHVFGLSSVLNGAVRKGASVVLVPRFDATAVVDAIERHRATIFTGVPTMYFALLEVDLAGRDVSSLRAAISGGASIPGAVIHRFEERFPGVVVLEGYGLSETASSTTFNVSAQERRVLSIGRPLWGLDVRIVDADGVGLPPGPDHVGEIVVRGHNVMKGYYKNPEATAAAIRDGWFHTGDLGYADVDGYFFVVDRLKDLIIRGGYNVYPREVEEILYDHPLVAEAAVVGRPDERLGEEVVAYVAAAPGVELDVDHLDAHCRERLAAYKRPREFQVLPALPKGATGKILKTELRPAQVR